MWVYFFVGNLMIHEVLRHIVLDGRMTDGWSNAKDMEGNGYGIMKVLFWELLVGSEETI